MIEMNNRENSSVIQCFGGLSFRFWFFWSCLFGFCIFAFWSKSSLPVMHKNLTATLYPLNLSKQENKMVVTILDALIK
jgi:hypothetical protein